MFPNSGIAHSYNTFPGPFGNPNQNLKPGLNPFSLPKKVTYNIKNPHRSSRKTNTGYTNMDRQSSFFTILCFSAGRIPAGKPSIKLPSMPLHYWEHWESKSSLSNSRGATQKTEVCKTFEHLKHLDESKSSQIQSQDSVWGRFHAAEQVKNIFQ